MAFRLEDGLSAWLVLERGERADGGRAPARIDAVDRLLHEHAVQPAGMMTLRRVLGACGCDPVERLADDAVIATLAGYAASGVLVFVPLPGATGAGTGAGADGGAGGNTGAGAAAGEREGAGTAATAAASGARRQAAPGAREPRACAAQPVPATAPAGILPPAGPTLTWVEIRLIGEDGKPIAGAAYQFRACDGVLHAGVTNVDGVGRVEGIVGPDGDFTFTELDEEAWRHA